MWSNENDRLTECEWNGGKAGFSGVFGRRDGLQRHVITLIGSLASTRERHAARIYVQ